MTTWKYKQYQERNYFIVEQINTKRCHHILLNRNRWQKCRPIYSENGQDKKTYLKIEYFSSKYTGKISCVVPLYKTLWLRWRSFIFNLKRLICYTVCTFSSLVSLSKGNAIFCNKINVQKSKRDASQYLDNCNSPLNTCDLVHAANAALCQMHKMPYRIYLH